MRMPNRAQQQSPEGAGLPPFGQGSGGGVCGSGDGSLRVDPRAILDKERKTAHAVATARSAALLCTPLSYPIYPLFPTSIIHTNPLNTRPAQVL